MSNCIQYDDGEVSAVIDGTVYYFGHCDEHGWYTGDSDAFVMYPDGASAAAAFRRMVDCAMMLQEMEQAEQPEPPFVPGRVRLEAADWLPV